MPKCSVWLVTILKKLGCFHSFCLESLVLFGLLAGCRINLLKLCNSKWCLLRVSTCIIRIKVAQIWLPLLETCDNKSHLKSPVSKVNVTDYLVTCVSKDSLNTLTNYCRTKMSYMKRLSNVWSAIIYDICRLVTWHCNAHVLLVEHSNDIASCEVSAYCDVEESRLNRFNLVKHVVALELLSYFISNDEWSLAIFLGTSHSTITLVLTQVRSVRDSYSSELPIISSCLKCISYFLRN